MQGRLKTEWIQKYLLLLFAIFNTISASAQNFEIGNWREHLPYIHAKKVVEGNGRIYCATDDGFYSYDLTEKAVERKSKLNGLSDFGITDIAYSTSFHLLVIAYTSTNIDLLYDDGQVLNISDIKRKNIPGNKRINSVSIDGRYAYISCGFGIVVLDLQRQEVKDTYYVGAGGGGEVYQLTYNDTSLFAAAADGIYQANKSNPLLANAANWNKIYNDISGQGIFNLAVNFNSILFFNYSKSSGDTLLAFNGNWGYALPLSLKNLSPLKNLQVSQGNLVVVTDDSALYFDQTLAPINTISSGQIWDPTLRSAIKDHNGNFWVADNNRGLYSNQGSTYSTVMPQGPYSSGSNDIQFNKGVLWMTHGPKNRTWANQYGYNGFSKFDNGSWTTYDGLAAQTPYFGTYNFYDNVSVAIDPSNSNHVFIGASGPGLLEINNGQAITLYRDNNSSLTQQVGNPGQVKVHGIAFDDNNNLWVSNAGTLNVINVRKSDGQWKGFKFPGIVNSSSKCGNIIIDQNGYKWLTLFENVGGKEGILVFNDNRTIDNTSDDQYDVVDFGSNRVRTIQKDLEGTIWAGTDQGVYLFYPPSITPQQILIKQDNSYQYLLATDVVTVIAIDGANRKWIGTESSGLYLLSADGQNQIKHFTIENSPLFSNNITSLSINDVNGEVFIGTEKGLISYQSDATNGEKENCSDLVVYPNPVEKGYDGEIAIKGVIANGTIKITDVSGGLVFEGKSLGGQAIWDGKNLKGEKVNSGVYIVYSSDSMGQFHCTTKLMIHR
ncbi:MAG: hypothetical protein ACKOX3_08575 [Bacteroidota bacterium]